ncbi:MAG: hypothetical protein JWM91_1917, partial [Rhodospirillales bacterium]|nr:hypothetical protein [Rhodospirillales bacterium]
MRRDPTLPARSRGSRSWAVAVMLCMAFIVACLLRHVSASDLPSSSPDSAPPSQEFEPPFPFNAAELWRQLAKVTELHGADMTRAQIESIFGVTLHPVEKHIGKTSFTNFEVSPPKDWYYKLVFSDSGKLIYFAFDWGGYVPFPSPKGDICILRRTVEDSLASQGWKSAGQERGLDIPIGDHF